MPFDEALAGLKVPLDRTESGEPTTRGDPALAQAEVAKWADAPPLPEPRDRRANRPLPAGTEAPIVSNESSTPKANRVGRPETHDWEDFWIEVAAWMGTNGVLASDRQRLQSDMESWTATQSANPPDRATIRKKLRKLYARGTRGI
jgi:hypothetical protein